MAVQAKRQMGFLARWINIVFVLYLFICSFFSVVGLTFYNVCPFSWEEIKDKESESDFAFYYICLRKYLHFM